MPPRTSSPYTSTRLTTSSRWSVASCRRPRVEPNDNGYLHLAGRGTGACRPMSDMMIASIVVGGLNVVLASVLLFVYRGVYVRTKAPFTLALLLFATAFLVQNAIDVYSFVTIMSLVPGALDPYLLAVCAFEALRLAAMPVRASRCALAP